MKRIIGFLAAAALAAAVLGSFACSMSDRPSTTPAPSSSPTALSTQSGMLKPSASPSASPAASASPDASGSPAASPSASASPDMSAGPEASASPEPSPGASAKPNAAPGAEEIDGFMEGKVVDPSEIPEIASRLGREFPEHSIQSATHEYFEGQQVYRIVLQGDGELSRVLYVYPNGSILLPAGAD